jgi:hypothetical protein
VEGLPNAAWRRDARYVLYSVGGFTGELRRLAESDGNLYLVDGNRLFASEVEQASKRSRGVQ